MKKFILNSLLFFLLASVFYVVVMFFWVQLVSSSFKPNINYRIASSGHMYSRLSEVKTAKDVDILFLGSSLAYRGFDPRVFSSFGYNSFNLGSSGQTPLQTAILLKRYIESTNPKTVVFEVNPVVFDLDGVESSLDIIANDKNDFYSLEMAFKINHIKTYNTLLYGFCSDILGLNNSIKESSIKEDDKYISGGFVEKELSFYSPKSFEKKKISIKDSQLESFQEIVELVESKNIKLILVYPPISSVEYNSYTNISFFDSLMSQHSQYYNFNELVSLNDSLHFYDSHHLNQNGVTIFNKKLVELLEETNAQTH